MLWTCLRKMRMRSPSVPLFDTAVPKGKLAHPHSDTTMTPKGVVLAPGAYVGSEQAGWTRTVSGTERRAVTVNCMGLVRSERLAVEK